MSETRTCPFCGKGEMVQDAAQGIGAYSQCNECGYTDRKDPDQ